MFKGLSQIFRKAFCYFHHFLHSVLLFTFSKLYYIQSTWKFYIFFLLVHSNRVAFHFIYLYTTNKKFYNAHLHSAHINTFKHLQHKYVYMLWVSMCFFGKFRFVFMQNVRYVFPDLSMNLNFLQDMRTHLAVDLP